MSALKIRPIPYERRKIAEWLMRLVDLDLEMNYRFFECLEWATGDLRHAMKKILEAVKAEFNGNTNQEVFEAIEAITDASKWSRRKLSRNFDNIIDDYPCIADIVKSCIKLECSAAASSPSPDARHYARIKTSFRKFFNLSRESGILCEFIYFYQTYSVLEHYTDEIEIWKFNSRNTLAHMLNISVSALQDSIKYLDFFGLIDDMGHSFRLTDSGEFFWKGGSDLQDMSKFFCAPLTGQIIPLEKFRVSRDSIQHVKELLSKKAAKGGSQKDPAPVHIMLYGPPGTGKTTFVRSLAKSLGVKVWTVASREDDNDSDRRTSLIACLNLAKKHSGSFVLVDEAERLLHTSWHDHHAKDKAWLNSFLEQPGSRVIWITNQIEHIDQAVRRRFSFSVYFDDLGKKERQDIWEQITARHRVKKCLPETQMKSLAENYKIPPAVIEQAVSQAKEMTYGKLNGSKEAFCGIVERVVQAHVTLRENGKKPKPKIMHEEEYTLSGVCLDGSVDELMNNCRRADAVYTEKGALRRGGGSMLFYGPPGTGKTALARYIAHELGRECLVQRASDLQSPFVGVAEANVAQAFRSAEEEGAVLVIDEADSFLYSREIAQRSWEVSIVNEFLTALEECKGFCICTTNRMTEMDAAAMRRFSFKVGFTYAGAEQIAALYSALLAPLAKGKLPRDMQLELCNMKRLTPGDFHSVRSQFWLAEHGEVSHESLIRSLKREQQMKLERGGRHVGFCA